MGLVEQEIFVGSPFYAFCFMEWRDVITGMEPDPNLRAF
jgi:hypothetical protein